MKSWNGRVKLVGVLLCAAAVWLAGPQAGAQSDAPAPSAAAPGAPVTPATQGDAGADAVRLTFLGNQLSADEAAIASLNDALHWAGYHVNSANAKADRAAYDNKRMDLNAGGPVPWEQFYGRTAKDFLVRDRWGLVYRKVPRPDQFNYIYKGNNQQIDKAKADVAAIGKQIDALLARRRQLEAEQSALWATIAFESIGNREIPLRPLYRNELAARSAKEGAAAPTAARVAALRAAVLYLRTLDHAVATLTDSLETRQGGVYVSLRDTLANAQESLQDAAVRLGDTPMVLPEQAKEMMDLLALAKKAHATCKDLEEAFRKGGEADAASEDGRKLVYRAALQESLFTFAEAAGQFDDKLMKMAEEWEIGPQAGTASKDQPLAIATPAAPRALSPPMPAAPNTPAAAVAPQTPATNPPATDSTGWIDLLAKSDKPLVTSHGTEINADGWRITGKKGHISTASPVSVPFRLEAVAKTNSDNIRLGYGRGLVILNWEDKPSELRFHDLRTGVPNAFPEKGAIPKDIWVKIDWVVTESYAEVYVDGALRGRIEGVFKGMSEVLSIRNGPDKKASTVTVQSLKWCPLPAAASAAPPVEGARGQASSIAPNGARTVDLLGLVDIEKDTVSGTWSMDANGLRCQAAKPARLQFSYRPPEEYDFRIVFTRESGENAVTQMGVSAGQPFAWFMGNTTNSYFVIYRLFEGSGWKTNSSAIKTPHALDSGRTYTSVVKVRKGSIETYLDDQLITRCAEVDPDHKVDVSDSRYEWHLRDKDVLGLGAWDSPTTFKQVEVIEVSGPGKTLR